MNRAEYANPDPAMTSDEIQKTLLELLDAGLIVAIVDDREPTRWDLTRAGRESFARPDAQAAL